MKGYSWERETQALSGHFGARVHFPWSCRTSKGDGEDKNQKRRTKKLTNVIRQNFNGKQKGTKKIITYVACMYVCVHVSHRQAESDVRIYM